MRVELDLFAVYFQFYLQDKDRDGDLSHSWCREAVKHLLTVAPGVVDIGRFRNIDACS